MSDALIVALIGGAVAVLTAGFVLIKGLGENRTAKSAAAAAARSAAAAAAQAQFEANLELNKYIDGRVEAALKEPLEQIAQLEQRVELLTTRERTTKDILRRWVQRLLWWNERGRKGEMPMPSQDDMATLDLSDIESDTITRSDVDVLIQPPTEKEHQ